MLTATAPITRIATLATWILGDTRKRRVDVSFTLSAIAVYTLAVFWLWDAVHEGRIDPPTATWLTAAIAISQVSFYGLVRTGLLQRWTQSSPWLPQAVVAMLILAWSYHVNPHVRGMLLMLVILTLSYSSLGVRPRECVLLGAYTLALFAGVMHWGAANNAAVFDPGIESIHFGFLSVAIPMEVIIARWTSQLRQRSLQQRRDLATSLCELGRIATHDALTDLPNRRAANEWLPQEAARCSRLGVSLCMAVIDIDHFKRINDTHGHAVGDAVLQWFAREAATSVRQGDMLARWGGEEFLWLMVGASAEDAESAIERLRSVLDSASASSADLGWRVTFSAGVAPLDERGDVTASLRRADAMLYAAKIAGRNCTRRA